MSLIERFQDYVRACFTGLWLESQESQEALGVLRQLCAEERWRLACWDLETGWLCEELSAEPVPEVSINPLTALRAAVTIAAGAETTLIVLQNFHRFLQSAEIVQALSQLLLVGRQQRIIVVILAPVVQLPIELEKQFVVLEHELPTRSELAQIGQELIGEEETLPETSELERVLDAAVGLTRLEAENAFSLALVREGRLTARTIWELKTQALKKSGLLSLYQGEEDFSSLGGLTALKSFCKRALLQPSRGNSLRQARGVLLLSPPGCGKSQFCKALGKEVGRPVLMLDVGNLLGSLVGQSEERTRQALRQIEAMAPCIAMLDECEKAFAGARGQSDSGVSARVLGTFLSWLNDRTGDVFVVCTANDISRLPPEFARSERFDGVFFLDLPTAAEKAAIWSLYLERFELDPNQKRPADEQWTGAEIKACCRLAALLELPLEQAAQKVVPVAVTAAESVSQLRSWASGRCLSAQQPGVYQSTAASPRRSRRQVNSTPNQN